MAIPDATGKSIEAHIDGIWEDSIISTLKEFIRIPNESPAFDREWQRNGHMDRAVSSRVGCGE